MTIIESTKTTTVFNPGLLAGATGDCSCNKLCVINWKQPNPVEEIINPAPLTTLNSY